MSRPIPLTSPPRNPRVELISRLESAPAQHAEAILAAYEVLQGLHDRGVLDLLRGALGSSDKVLEIAMQTANSPRSIRSVRNLILLVNLLGDIDPQQLGGVTRAVPDALKSSERDSRPPGIWKLVTAALCNGNIRRGLWAALSLLETFGKNIGKTTG